MGCKVTIFSSNQPRHLYLARALTNAGFEVVHVCEVTTAFPGSVEDFYKKSKALETYFRHVKEAEKLIFGESRLVKGVSYLPVKMGDLNQLSERDLSTALDSQVFIVFGSSFIKGWLVDELISRHAVNIHMGLSPFYRGTACNFWALYDENISMVGGTVHFLARGLDNGPIIESFRPTFTDTETPFIFTMQAVKVTIDGLILRLQESMPSQLKSRPQDATQLIRYSRKTDFNDAVASDFLERWSISTSRAL